MKPAVMVALLAVAASVTGGTALVSVSDDLVPGFECEDLVEGDRVEFRSAVGAQGEMRVRADADTRFRIEVEFEPDGDLEAAHEADDPVPGEERRARLRMCGFVFFVDNDRDGALGPNDRIVRSDLVAFGPLAVSDADGAWVFRASSSDGSLRVTAQVRRNPAPDAPLIEWGLEASPSCASDATHFSVLVDELEPIDRETRFASECGSSLVAMGEA